MPDVLRVTPRNPAPYHCGMHLGHRPFLLSRTPPRTREHRSMPLMKRPLALLKIALTEAVRASTARLWPLRRAPSARET